MSKAAIVSLIGLLFATIPINGLPSVFNSWLLVVGGVAIFVLGLLLRVERLWLMRALSGGHSADAYSENGTPKKTPDA